MKHVFCSNCCSTLNGVNGEATNSDDVKGVNRRQDQQIRSLKQSIRKLKLDNSRKNKKSKSTKRNRQRSRKQQYQNQILQEPVASIPTQVRGSVTSSPLKTSILAQMLPRAVPRGGANLLFDTRPSQKITARAVASVTLAAGSTLYMYCQPAPSNDVPSLALYHTANPAQTPDTVGIGRVVASTNTPYNFTTLSDPAQDINYRFVSASIVVRITSNALNRGGVFVYVVDTDRHHEANYATLAFQTWLTDLNSDISQVRKSLVTQDTFEITVPHNVMPYVQLNSWSGGDARFPGGSGFQTTNAPTWFCESQAVLGALLNSSTAAMTIEFEIVEHWEFNGRLLHSVHTPSVASAAVSTALSTITTHAHKSHSMLPHLHFKDVVKGAMKIVENKEVVEAAPEILEVAAAI